MDGASVALSGVSNTGEAGSVAAKVMRTYQGTTGAAAIHGAAAEGAWTITISARLKACFSGMTAARANLSRPQPVANILTIQACSISVAVHCLMKNFGAVGNYLAQNGIDINTLMEDNKPGLWNSVKDGASWLGSAWKNLGPVGQMVLGSAATGGLSTYLQNRQRDQELASLSGMKEDEFNRAVSLKRQPTRWRT